MNKGRTQFISSGRRCLTACLHTCWKGRSETRFADHGSALAGRPYLDWTYTHLGARIAACRQGSPVPSSPVPVWLYVPVRQSYCYIYRIQTIGVAHASTTTASSIAERACSSSSNSSEETVEDGSEQQQQAAAAGAAATTRRSDRSIDRYLRIIRVDGRIDGHILLTWLACRLPDGRRGAAGRQRQEAGTPGEDDLARGEGLHRRMVNYQSQT